MENLEFINSEKIVRVEFEEFWEKNSLEFSEEDKFITIKNPHHRQYIDDRGYALDLIKEYKYKFWLSNKAKVKKINERLKGKLVCCKVCMVRDDFYGDYSDIEIDVVNINIRDYEDYLKENISHKIKERFDIDYHNTFVNVPKTDFPCKEYTYLFNFGFQHFYGRSEKVNQFIEKYYDKKTRMIITTTRYQDEYILTPKEAKAYINKFRLNDVYIEMNNGDK